MERIRCKRCGEFLTKAITGSGPMNESGLVLMFKMLQGALSEEGEKDPLDDMDGIECGGCGASSFEIVETPG